MSFCPKCGASIEDGTSFCPSCGANLTPNKPVEPTGLQKTARVFMIIAAVIECLYIIPMAWVIPMCVSYKRKITNGIKVGTGFKVCTLLFVSTIAGILMLCDNN